MENNIKTNTESATRILDEMIALNPDVAERLQTIRELANDPAFMKESEKVWGVGDHPASSEDGGWWQNDGTAGLYISIE